jgi:hypothetical protein
MDRSWVTNINVTSNSSTYRRCQPRTCPETPENQKTRIAVNPSKLSPRFRLAHDNNTAVNTKNCESVPNKQVEVFTVIAFGTIQL